MQKIAHRLIIFSIALFHFIFLGAILWDNTDIIWLIPGLAVIAVFLGVIFKQAEASTKSILRKREIVYIVGCSCGALLTYWLNLQFGFGVVLSAGLVGLIAGFIPRVNSRSSILNNIPVAIYCGAFVGMTAKNVANGYAFILSSSLVTGVMLMLARNSLNGYGGKLGTLAFGGVCIVYSLIYLANAF